MANTWNQSGTTWGTGRYGTTEAFTLGWGVDPYNDAASTWGDVGDEIVVLTAPDAMTAKVSAGSAWGDDTWGEEQSWGQFVLNPANVMGLTGVSSTASVGSPTIISDATFTLTGVSAGTTVGSIFAVDSVGLVGVSATASVGSISPADVMGVTGVSAEFRLGQTNQNSNPLISLTGLSLTSSVGSLSPADVMGLTGVSATGAVGSLSPADVMGLTGVSATASTGEIGVQAYQDVDTGSNISYSDVATGTNITYSDVA